MMSNLTRMFQQWQSLLNEPPRPVSIPKIVVHWPGTFKHGKLARRRGVAGKRIRGWTNPLSRRSYMAKSLSMESYDSFSSMKLIMPLVGQYDSGPSVNPAVDLEIDFNINFNINKE